MSFPKSGKFFPNGDGARGSDDGGGAGTSFAGEIAAALHRSLGSTRGGAQTAVKWTGANEKTVKNWFSGRYGPSGEHPVDQVRHSDDVLVAFLAMAGCDHLLVGYKLAAAEEAIIELLVAVRGLSSGYEPGTSEYLGSPECNPAESSPLI